MNRVIKFRAWDKENRKMLYQDVDFGYISSQGIDLLTTKTINGGTKHTTNVELMQFTGLHDKNGKEIYEGDIVGEEGVYHYISRDGWEPEPGIWKIIGKKTKDFYNGEEWYIAGYKLKVVRWEDDSCGFEPFSDSEENCGHCGWGRNNELCEVLGNIYENPELLTTNTHE
jgi:uncharacterized phage protein (TIGR01671 family)